MTAAESRARAKRSPIWWLGVFSRILNKAKELVRPKPNIFQIRMAMAEEYCRQRGIMALIIGCKPRQVGGTTEAAAQGYHRMRRKPADGVAIGDILDRSDKLFKMYQRFRENDALDWGQQDAPGTADLLHIGKSKLEKKTAENPSASRASTLQYIHMSEVAFWPQGGARDAVETFTALMGSLAKNSDSLCFVESTPKGSSGLFAQLWLDAQWPDYDDYWTKYAKKQENGGSAWIRVFAAWFEFEEYALEVSKEETEKIMSTLSPREKTGIQTYGWTAGQIAWRRRTIRTDCSNSEIKFDEEYPEDPVTCFQASGSPRFDVAGMDYLQKIIDLGQASRVGMLSDVGPNGGRPTFTPTAANEAWLQLWELPKVGCKYFIGGDVAEDKDMNPATGSNEVKRDRHSFWVVRSGFLDNKGVRWRPRAVGRVIPPCRWGHDLLAKRLHLMSLLYGGCPIAPEMNNHGLALAKELKRLEANLYSQTIIDPLDNSEKTIYGHRTTPANRPDVIEHLAKSIRNAPPKVDELEDSTLDPESLEVFCPHALAEMRVFVIGKDGKAVASSGNHDDDVMGLAITYYLLGSATIYVEKVVERKIPSWDYRVVRDTPERRSITGS